MSLLWLMGVLFVCLFIGIPIAVSLGLAATIREWFSAGGSVATAVVITREADREDPSRPADTRVTGLPLFPWRDGVRTGLLCGQAAMTDGAARRLGEAGLVPVAWARGDDAVRVLVPRSATGTPLV